MKSYTPNNDVQRELEQLSPLLARLRAQKAGKVAETDMDSLQALGCAALLDVPIEREVPPSKLKRVYRKSRWMKPLAAAIALLLASLIGFSIYNTSDSMSSEIASTNEKLSEELIASYEAETADPIVFLLDDDIIFDEDDELYFSPAEDVLLDWADDGYVNETLSEEMMFGAVW